MKNEHNAPKEYTRGVQKGRPQKNLDGYPCMLILDCLAQKEFDGF